MYIHDATEEAYKNGYDKGYEDGKKDAIKVGKPEINLVSICNSDSKPVYTYQNGYKCPFCNNDGIKHFCPQCGAEMDWSDINVKTN